MVTHLHGGNSDFQFDGNPEFFYSPDGGVKGPQWDFVPGGFTNTFRYDNSVPAGNLWYHDHAIGITRLNVYAGLAGFYFLRDPLESRLPNGDYEVPIVIQDRTFDADGELFYPPGDDNDYEAEFAADIPVVNGKAYPNLTVEPRKYRFRL